MNPVSALTHLGGVAPLEHLMRHTTRGRLRTAVDTGEVMALTRGRFALPTADTARAAAARLNGVVSHLSAAAYWEWEVKVPPEQPQVCVPRGRKVDAERRAGVELRWRALSEAELARGVTGMEATVVDCARDLAFDEALAVADSALRHAQVTRDQLAAAARRIRGPRAAVARRVLLAADGRAENPFESVLRAQAIDEGLDVVPQQPIDLAERRVTPDLVDAGRRLVIEADSWTYHAEKSAFSRDMWRYNALVVEGWRVLRFTREMVMDQPDRVRAVLRAARSGGR